MADRRWFRRRPALTSTGARVNLVDSGTRGLVAAATRLDLADRPEAGRQMRLRQGWQLNAWAYRDQIGELRYAVNYLANCAARMRIFPAAYPATGESDMPVALDKLEEEVPAQVLIACAAAMRSLGNGRNAVSRMMHTLSTNQSVAGECFLVGQEDPATGEDVWSIRSVSEILVKDDRYYLREVPSDSQGAFGTNELDPETTVISRIWRPHPQWRLLADSPLRAMQDDCESLLILRRTIRAAGRSRLAGRGLLLVPEELQIKTPNSDNLDPEADDFLGMLGEAMMTPIDNEGSAAAVVPVLVRGPGDKLEQVRHIDMAFQFDEMSSKTREELIGVIATTIDLPKEVVTGTVDLNHWSAWAVDDNTFRHHVEPDVIHNCDCLTGAHLRPFLEDAGVPREWMERLLYWYDPTELVTHPDQTSDAKDLYDRHALSAEALATTAGFSESDMPSAEETVVRMLQNMRNPPPNLVMAAVHQMFPQLTIPPIESSGTVPGVKPTGVDTGDPPALLGPGAPPAVAVDSAPAATPPAPGADPGPPPEDRTDPKPVIASAGPNTGAMIALYPSPELAAAWALPDGEPAAELHLTLAFLGQAADLADPDALKTAVEAWASQTAPITGEISGVGLFTAGEDPVTYLSPDLPSLPDARQQLVDALSGAGAEPSQEHGFTPHITLDYADRVGDVDASVGGSQITFDSVAVVLGEDRADYPFSQALTAAGVNRANERLSRKLSEIDRDLRARLQIAANAAMLRHLERVGNRLRRSVAKDETLRAKIAHARTEHVAATLGPEVVTAAGVNVGQMLGDAWTGLHAQFDQWTKTAQSQALKLAARLAGVPEHDDALARAQQQMDANRDTAWGTLSDALDGLSQHLLYNPDPNVTGEEFGDLNLDTLVPAGAIRGALAIAGGADTAAVTVADRGTVTTSGFVGQLGTGPTVSDLLTGAGGQVAQWQWNHASTVITPFEPHLDLDGAEFSQFDDDVLVNPGDWPPVAYLHPGDHDGCTCDAAPLWEFPGNPLNDSTEE